jgi:mannose-6-phosphate isomerase-like protein (cupin superfamily)
VAEPYTLKRIDEMEAHYAGTFKLARAELGVTSFGIQVIDLPANVDAYPAHDHTENRQEEVFVVLSGEGEIVLDGETLKLEPRTMIRMAPEVNRKLVTKDSPLSVLALGAVPGETYEVDPATELGSPDPLTQQS